MNGLRTGPWWVGPTVGEIGELGVLERITRRLSAVDVIVGPGDDCAVIAAPDGRFAVTTDMMVHGPDFRWAWSTPEDIGWKAAATNLSDIAAMGARPTALVTALAVPSDTPVAVLEGIADGISAACSSLAPGCGVVGGDLSTSPVASITVTAFGDLEGRHPILRSGAVPGDVLAIAGELGPAGRGLARLFRDGVDAYGTPDAECVRASGADADPDVGRQRRPVPPIRLGPIAAASGATAMLDISDGLAIDASRLARASGVTLDLVSGIDGAALYGGEDHGLLATFPSTVTLPVGFRPIGAVIDRGEAEVLRGGMPVAARGWDPYADWDGGTD